MKQIFFITDDRMTAMLWSGSELIAKYEFEDNEKGLTELSDYLEESKNIQASVILDILEDEVTLATIPHVALHERKFLIDRTLERLHRGTEFSTANIIGREDNLRRDDKLLVSGLTKDRPLLKWLDVFNENEVIIKGVYSLPLIADSVLKVLKIKKGLTLLVSRQSRDFIRQSIFKDGKLFYSRNIPSSQNFNIETVTSDLKKTRKYLENQKLLNVDDRIDVVILASDRFYKQLSGLDEMLPDMNITYVEHDGLKKALGIKSEYKIGGKEIFSSLLAGSLTKDHYGRKQDLERFKKKSLDNKLNLLSVAIAVIFSVMSIKLYLDINVLDNKLQGVEVQLISLGQQNDRLASDMSELPVKAKKMKLFVENVSDVKKASEAGIEISMIKISQVFNAYKNISLEGLKWNINGMTNNRSSKARGRRNTRKSKGLAETSNSMGQVLEVVANIEYSSLGKQKTMLLVERFIASINAIKAVKSVRVTKQPIKASSADRMVGEISEKSKSEAEFAFTVIMEADNNAS